MSRPKITFAAPTVDSENAGELAAFYARLLGWNKVYEDARYVIISPVEDGTPIIFQTVEIYEKPVWPWQKGTQGPMAHLDFNVENLEEAAQYAMECGATRSSEPPSGTLAVMIDPAGHPFCLVRPPDASPLAEALSSNESTNQ